MAGILIAVVDFERLKRNLDGTKTYLIDARREGNFWFFGPAQTHRAHSRYKAIYIMANVKAGAHLYLWVFYWVNAEGKDLSPSVLLSSACISCGA